MPGRKLLTKSKYLIGLQCPKYLWCSFNEPDRIPKPGTATQYRFDQGKLAGELAKKLFPNGVNIPTEDFMANIRQAKELTSQGKLVFEAGILAGNVYSRADILSPVGNSVWDIIEVKSSTKVKEEHIHDLSFQKYCCEIAGLKIRKTFLLYINNTYVREGEIDPNGLFNQDDITDQVNDAMVNIQERIDSMLNIIAATECPDVAIGKQCSGPYDCPLKNYCWGFLPDGNVFDLYRGGKKSFDLFKQGIYAIRDIPGEVKLTEKQNIQRDCELTSHPYINKEGLREFLNGLTFPLYYLDFETFSPVIPLFDGMRPYQRVPFQFSLHVVGDSTEHHSFLADGTDNPRPEFLSSLKKVLGKIGSIIVYNQVFEKGVLEELAQAFPEYRSFVDSVFSRIVDLLVPFRNFHYYHPSQKGSASIKYVLPTLTGVSYANMGINNGEDASVAFVNVTFGNVSEEERQKVRANLEEYCCLDTEGMIWIVDKVRELSSRA